MIGGHAVVHPSPGVEPAALLGKVGLQLLDHLVSAGAVGSPTANKSWVVMSSKSFYLVLFVLWPSRPSLTCSEDMASIWDHANSCVTVA